MKDCECIYIEERHLAGGEHLPRTKKALRKSWRLATWCETVLTIMKDQLRQSATDDLTRKAMKKAVGRPSPLKKFIKRFNLTTKTVNKIQEILKNQGLNQTTYKAAKALLGQLSKKLKTGKKLQKWLDRTLDLQCRLGIKQSPLPVSNDVIEALFGKFKIHLHRLNGTEINEMALTILVLTGEISENSVAHGLNQVTHKALEAWVTEYIQKTNLARRRAS